MNNATHHGAMYQYH